MGSDADFLVGANSKQMVSKVNELLEIAGREDLKLKYGFDRETLGNISFQVDGEVVENLKVYLTDTTKELHFEVAPGVAPDVAPGVTTGVAPGVATDPQDSSDPPKPAPMLSKVSRQDNLGSN
jgi:hypothetical protein